MDVKAGTRFACSACGSEVIALRPKEPELTCCGKPMTAAVKS